MLEAFGLKGIDILVQRRKDKPRRELLIALVTLRRDMTDCHGNYLAFERSKQQAGSNHDRSSQIESPANLKDAWIESLRRLQEDFRELDTMLRIYGPEAHRYVASYGGGDAAADAEVAELFPEPEDFCESLGIDLQEVISDPKFSVVLAKLDVFIKENFKPDEVFAALSGK